MKYLSAIPETETAEVAQLIEQFQNTWNSKSVPAMADLFTEDAEFTDIMGQIARGIEQINKMHEFIFQKMMKAAVLEVDDLYIRNIGEHLLLVTGKWTTEGHTDFSGNTLPKRGGVIQIICRTTDNNNRKISLVYNTDLTQSYVESARHKLKFLG